MSKFPPLDYSYFLATVHGTGVTSFLKYLKLIGMPATGIANQEDELIQLKKEYSCFGLTLADSQDFKLKHRFLTPVPAILLVRDPIEQILSYYNILTLGDGIIQTCSSHMYLNHDNFFKIHSYKDDFLDLINGEHQRYLLLKPIFRLLNNITDVTLIDTCDILPQTVENTMKNLASKFGIKYDESVSPQLLLSQNDFAARFWLFLHPFALKAENDPFDHPKAEEDKYIKVNIYPEHLLTFAEDRKILDTIEVYGQKYYIVVFESKTAEIQAEKAKFEYDKEILIYRIKILLEHIENMEKIYKKNRLSKEELVSIINKNKKLKDIFIRLFKPTATLVDSFAKGHTCKHWKYYQQIK